MPLAGLFVGGREGQHPRASWPQAPLQPPWCPTCWPAPEVAPLPPHAAQPRVRWLASRLPDAPRPQPAGGGRLRPLPPSAAHRAGNQAGEGWGRRGLAWTSGRWRGQGPRSSRRQRGGGRRSDAACPGACGATASRRRGSWALPAGDSGPHRCHHPRPHRSNSYNCA